VRVLASKLLDIFVMGVTGVYPAKRPVWATNRTPKVGDDEEDITVTEKSEKLGLGLEVKTVRGRSGRAYLAFRTQEGKFHIFREVSAEESAEDCGASSEGSVEQMWEDIWNDGESRATR
jgi:hypothetical protein